MARRDERTEYQFCKMKSLNAHLQWPHKKFKLLPPNSIT